MISNVVFACLCTLLVVWQGQAMFVKPEAITWYDLKTAERITDNIDNDINKVKYAPKLGAGASGAGGIFKNCSKSTDKFWLINVIVEGCTASPCILKKGTEAHVQIDFTASENTTIVTAKVYGEIAGVMVPFPLTNPNACTCGITCPTKPGAHYTYKYSLPVSEEYPSLQVPVLWYFYDAEKTESLCMSVLTKIE